VKIFILNGDFMKAIRIDKFGGADVLQVFEGPIPEVGPKDVLVKLDAAGINFIDIYQRTGLYKVNLPYVLGLEGAGFVEEIGPDVTIFSLGDRVAYAGVPGSYAQYCVVPADRLVKLPAGVSTQQAAAVMLQGMTAHYLSHTTYPLKPGDTCLVHAAAGGVGLLLVQMANKIGATVYATVSTQEKGQLAKDAGADHVIFYTKEDFEETIRKLTNGCGVNVVYDSVGKDTFDKGLNCLKPLGYMVLYGQASGKVPPIDPTILNSKGSLFLTRPSLFHYIADTASLQKRAKEVLAMVATDELLIRSEHKYPLEKAADAHRVLEGRKTAGKVLLTMK
jgi:NADPH:quinone reductase